MQLIRNSDNPNTVAGIMLLVLLLVFAGPNTIYNLVSRAVPGLSIDTPCDWLRTSPNRGTNQSLLGRAATNPLRLEVSSSAVPNAPGGTLTITVIVINRSLGTVPFLFNPTQVRVGDDGSSGLGIIFDATTALNSPGIRQDSGTYPPGDVRVLGPRQRCLYRAEFTFEQLQAAGFAGNSSVRAFYRINSAGVAPQQAGGSIFSDQGFRQLFITSEPVLIPLASQ
ncbi:MAG: hypothetical protein HXY40_07320 [Chloroflexi bacterium]|nr:hypothetical protein [Chloroflexota bacterium]